MSVSIHEMRYRLSPSQFQLQRLLDAFEKEQKSYGDESKRSIQMLEVSDAVFRTTCTNTGIHTQI